MIVNCGEVMMWWTGNYYKSAIHRVIEPPIDQRGNNRCSTIYFVLPNDGVAINTVLDQSSVVREAGIKMAFEPGQGPTSKEWSNSRIIITGVKPKIENDSKESATVDKVGKVTTTWYR
jgi:isopenicillin N synthase-like dioxygenase